MIRFRVDDDRRRVNIFSESTHILLATLRRGGDGTTVGCIARLEADRARGVIDHVVLEPASPGRNTFDPILVRPIWKFSGGIGARTYAPAIIAGMDNSQSYVRTLAEQIVRSHRSRRDVERSLLWRKMERADAVGQAAAVQVIPDRELRRQHVLNDPFGDRDLIDRAERSVLAAINGTLERVGWTIQKVAARPDDGEEVRDALAWEHDPPPLRPIRTLTLAPRAPSLCPSL